MIHLSDTGASIVVRRGGDVWEYEYEDSAERSHQLLNARRHAQKLAEVYGAEIEEIE